MRRILSLLAVLPLALAGCSSLEVPGQAKYFANQPGGLPFFKISSGITGPTMSICQPDGTWTKSRAMKPIGPTEPPLSTTPGLAQQVVNAHSIEGYAFLEFQPTATFQGQPVPSRYYLFPGGFAYPVPPP